MRDPRDVAISYSHHMGLSLDWTIGFLGDPEAATGGTDAKVYERHASWSMHVQSWTHPPDARTRVLQYEALVAAPEAAFAGLIGWLGQPPPPARLQRAIRFSDIAELRAQEAAKGFRERVAGSTALFFGAARPGSATCSGGRTADRLRQPCARSTT
jgi:hypothetical protein